MQELRLVAVSEDGTYLVLATAGRGTRFTLPVDDRLRAAVRGHFSRLGQFEIEVESPLRPKEIQARIRSGETAEEIAESAGIPVERIRWFEGPVLQEREYMAQQAQRVAVRRPGESTPGPPLGETVEQRLGRGGVDLDEAEWDSWKCEDNTWRVRLSFFDNGRPHAAEWVFDPRRRHVSPLDEIAARLTAVEWDEESLSDTVTPLVPRRPAMKVVSGDRGLPAEPEQPSGPEPLRAAEPREYVIERSRALDPRPSFPSAPEQAPTPLRHAAEAREPAEPLEAALARGAAQLRDAAARDAATREEVAREDAAREDAAARAEAAHDEAVEPAYLDESTDEPGDEQRGGRQRDEQDVTALREAEGGEGREDTEDTDAAEERDSAAAQPSDDEQGYDPDEAESASISASISASMTPSQRHDAPVEAAQPHADEQDEPAEADEAALGETGGGQAADDAAGGHPDAEEPKDAETAIADQPAVAATAEASAATEHDDEAVPEEEPAPRRASAKAADEAEVRSQEDAPDPAPDDAEADTDTAEKADDADLTPAARKAAAQRPAHRAPAKKKPAGRPAVPPAQDKPAAASETPAAAARAARGRRKAKGKRASVPSWDEIMFGARRPE